MEGAAGVQQGAAQTALRSSKLRVRAFHMRMSASTRRRMLAQQWPPRWRAHARSIAAGVGAANFTAQGVVRAGTC